MIKGVSSGRGSEVAHKLVGWDVIQPGLFALSFFSGTTCAQGLSKAGRARPSPGDGESVRAVRQRRTKGRGTGECRDAEHRHARRGCHCARWSTIQTTRRCSSSKRRSNKAQTFPRSTVADCCSTNLKLLLNASCSPRSDVRGAAVPVLGVPASIAGSWSFVHLVCRYIAPCTDNSRRVCCTGPRCGRRRCQPAPHTGLQRCRFCGC